MKKFERIHTILRYVQNRSRFTIREISETFNISRSTAIRDIQEIEGMGVPLVAEVGRDGGYFVVKNALTTRFQFTEDEIKALLLAFQASKNQQFPFLKGRQSLTEKLIALISDRQKDELLQLSQAIVFESTNPANTNLLELTDQANSDLETLIAAYLDGQDARVHIQGQDWLLVRVHRFYHTHETWTIEALDLDSHKVIMIHLSQVKAVEIVSTVAQMSETALSAQIKAAKPSPNIVLNLPVGGIRQFKKYHPVNFTIRYLDPFQTSAVVQGYLQPDIHESEQEDVISWLMFLGKDVRVQEAPAWIGQKLMERSMAIKKVVASN